MSNIHPILVGGAWRQSSLVGEFTAFDPKTARPLPDRFPVSGEADVEAALATADSAFQEMRAVPADRRARFLESFAAKIESATRRLAEAAHQETALPVEPRLEKVELPRTVNQLRLCAKAAREETWRCPTIDGTVNVRSAMFAIGPTAVFGPNNFPFAFNAVSGGDFAAAVAAGNPVIAKVHPSHPNTSRLLAELALQAAEETSMPEGAIQMLYHMPNDLGARMASDRRIGAVAFTGSKKGGLALKQIADQAGIPIYLELGSVNPVVILPGALKSRGEQISAEFTASALMGCGQFCTNPGLLFLISRSETERFIERSAQVFKETPPGSLFSKAVFESLKESVAGLQAAGAVPIVGGEVDPTGGWRFQNTLLRVSGQQFLENPEALQQEAFGNASLIVVCDDVDQLIESLGKLEGNLTGSIYGAGSEDGTAVGRAIFALERKVGRVIRDKMPTGVAVSPAMHHGGPFPAAWHPAFSAVGPPASLLRFSRRICFDNFAEAELPAILRDSNIESRPWRFVDGNYTRGDLPESP